MNSPFSEFYGKSWILPYNTEKRFLLEVSFYSQQKFLLKNGTRDFQNSRLFERSACFYVTVEILDVFSTLTWKQIFWKTKTLFQKMKYRFLIESTKIENASFSHKTAMLEANVKTNRVVSTNWVNHKERSNYLFFFWKFCFSLRTSYKELFWCTDIHIHTFSKRWNFIWGWFFPVSILKTRFFWLFPVR